MPGNHDETKTQADSHDNADGDDLYRCRHWDEAGFLWVDGRSKDLIISGGENIHPAELENVLADCAEIAESAVIGIEDPKWGEAACAIIVKNAGATLDEAGVLALFSGRLARYKHPRRVVFMDSLPRNAMGKVQKFELRGRIPLD